MSLRSVFVFVNFKAIFCLIFEVTLAKYAYTQNLYTAVLDETRNTLMSFSSGSSLLSSSPSPTPSTARKFKGKVKVVLHAIELSKSGMETKCSFRSNVTAISSLTSAKLLMVKVTGLLYCKEYLTGLCGLKREASHPTEKNAEKKKT